MRIVEFIGLPGAGKSTIARRVLSSRRGPSRRVLGYDDVLARATERDRGVVPLIAAFVSYNVAQPTLMREMAAGCLRGGPRLRWRISRALRTSELTRRLRRRMACDEIVLEQGPLQALLSWHWTGGRLDESSFERVVRRLYPEGAAVLVVAVSVSPDVARTRLRARSDEGGGRMFEMMEADQLRTVLEAGAQSLPLLTERLACLNVRILHLDGQADPGVNAELVLDCLPGDSV